MNVAIVACFIFHDYNYMYLNIKLMQYKHSYKFKNLMETIFIVQCKCLYEYTCK